MIKKQITLISLIIVLSTKIAFAKESIFNDLQKAPTNKVLSVLKDKLSSQSNKEENNKIVREYFNILLNEKLLVKIDPSYKKVMGDSWTSYGSTDIFENLEKIKDLKVRNSLKEAYSMGYKVVTTEGSAMFIADYDKLIKFLAPYLPANELDYYKIISKTTYVSEDGGLTITFDELFALIIEIETLIKKIDKNKVYELENSQMKSHINDLLLIYFRGIDNTPIFDYDTNKFRDKSTILGYQKNLKKYANTNSGKALKNYYSLLEKNKFVKTKEVDKFLETFKLYK